MENSTNKKIIFSVITKSSAFPSINKYRGSAGWLNSNVIMPMVQTADAAFVRCCFQTPSQEGKACLRPFRAILWCAAWFCWNKAGHFFQQENRPKISPFCIKSSHVFRRFHRHGRFLRGDCQPFHQPSELLRRQFTYFLRGARPLEPAF